MVLTDRLGRAPPGRKLELGDPLVGLEIVRSSGIAGAQREALHALAGLQDVRQGIQDPDGVDQDVDLPGDALDQEGGVQRLPADAVPSIAAPTLRPSAPSRLDSSGRSRRSDPTLS